MVSLETHVGIVRRQSFPDHFGRFPSEAFSGCCVEAVTDHFQFMICDRRDVALPAR